MSNQCFEKNSFDLKKQDLVILAARPGMGKTTFALKLVTQSSISSKVPTVYFSLEMSTESLVKRLLAMENAESIGESPLIVDDTPGISVSELCAKCRKVKQEKGLDLVIIDYLQLMTIDREPKSRQQEISEISGSLKALAKELDVTVIALSQLSRTVEQRSDKRPILSDLPEYKIIEPEADVILFLYRDEYYYPDTEESGTAEIIIAKQHS